MAYDNRAVGSLKIKGSPFKSDKPQPNVGETYQQYAKRAMSPAEFAKWDSMLDAHNSPRRSRVWDGKKWISKGKWEAKNKKPFPRKFFKAK